VERISDRPLITHCSAGTRIPLVEN
jgi:hypothetical protein